MKYLSVCSGIEAATVAWHPLGWTPAAFSEIEKFPRAVLQHHYPEVPLHGDFTTIGGDEYGAIDLLVGGTPCQSFSIAGLRGGLDDERGNLALEFLRLADRTGARWLVWENVPGVLSSNGGRDFGSILGGMVELGYGIAYRVLDAQHFGVPQRRRRVFVVGYLGDWRRAAAVLFERHGLQGNPAPRREKGQSAPTIPSRSTGGGGLGTDFDCDGGLIADSYVIMERGRDGTANAILTPNGGRGGLGVGAIAFNSRQEPVHSEDVFGTLDVAHPQAQSVAYSIMPMNSGKDYKARETDVAQPIMAGGPVGGNQGGDFVCAFMENQRGELRTSDHANLTVGGGKPGQGYPAALTGSAVRRLTPRECERLQGFPDDYTLIPWRGKPAELCPDGPRYKALGNSMAVPVMRWIGERIATIEALEPASERIAA